MIKIENTSLYGWEAAVRGMRNPMNSWDRSDSSENILTDDYDIGEKDLDLMTRLVKAGTDHSKFMRMITVTVDLTAPMYWWKEFDTYKIGTVRNSCSTMHKIHAKEFSKEDFSCEHLIITSPFEYTDAKTELTDIDGIDTGILVSPMSLLNITIGCLNNYRRKFIETKDKAWWWQMIQLLPSSYNQRATVQLNYAVLRNMYQARKSHKLDEWHDFCIWIETLPHAKELICDTFQHKEIFSTDNSVTITCYGKTQKWEDKKDAAHFYWGCMIGSEGAERDRYVNILSQLIAGETDCRDE